ncbi:hypothetical protein A4X06_0g8555, partial [Tilletia controversa]
MADAPNPDPAAAAAAAQQTGLARAFVEELRLFREGNAAGDKQQGLPSFQVDPDHADTVVEPWPGASFNVPADIVELNQERLNDAYRKDSFLPRGATHQAIQVLASLCRAMGSPTEDADKNHAVLLEEMHLTVITRATDEHWAVWRLYIKRCLEAMWAKRESGVGMAFDIGKINESLLRKAERQCNKPPGYVDDFTRTTSTLVADLLRAEGDTIGKVGAAMEALRDQSVYGPTVAPLPSAAAPPPSSKFQPTQPQASSSSGGPSVPALKRRERDWDDMPFQRAPPSYSPRDGGAIPPKGPRAGSDRPDRRPSLYCPSIAWQQETAAGATTARSAALTVTQHSSVTAPSRSGSAWHAFRVARLSPLVAQTFETALRVLPASHQVRLAHIVEGLKTGFSVGPLSLPNKTVIAPNHFKNDQIDIVRAWCDKALKDRYAHGPFAQSDIEREVGPFISIPLLIVHTSATSTKPEKNRVCFNASWPRLEHTDANAQAGEGIKSINEEVKDEGWECEWFLLEEVKTLLSTATTTATVMGFDLSDAYQQVPNLPAQRQRFVFSVEGQFFVWVVGMFGIATMSAIFGQLCDVLCAWLEHRFPSVRARHFADDHMVMRDAPVPTEDEVYEEVKFFGWKVHPTKRFGWTRQFALLGFTWDLDAGTVAIGEEKRDKYLRKLTIFQNKEKVTYRDVSSMLGT